MEYSPSGDSLSDDNCYNTVEQNSLIHSNIQSLTFSALNTHYEEDAWILPSLKKGAHNPLIESTPSNFVAQIHNEYGDISPWTKGQGKGKGIPRLKNAQVY